MPSYVIWQYWETVDDKPAFIDGLHALARKNSGAEVVLVTPETLGQFLSDIPKEVFEIAEIAHKTDMIRAMLVQQHGGMWLDVDAVVLGSLDWILDQLDKHEFVCFNNSNFARQQGQPVDIAVGCFASRRGGRVVSEWVRQQHAKFPRTEYRWREIGSELLNPICLDNKERVRVLPFEAIAPLDWDQFSQFTDRGIDASAILQNCSLVMLYNRMFKLNNSPLTTMTIEQIASRDYLLSAIIRRAINGTDTR